MNGYAGVKFSFNNISAHVIRPPKEGETLEAVRRQVDEIIYKHNQERKNLAAEVEFLQRELRHARYCNDNRCKVLTGRDKAIKRLKKRLREPSPKDTKCVAGTVTAVCK